MDINVNIKVAPENRESKAFIITQKEAVEQLPLNRKEQDYVLKKLDDDTHEIAINRISGVLFILKIDAEKEEYLQHETCRQFGHFIVTTLNNEKLPTLSIIDRGDQRTLLLNLTEGILLSTYRFDKYRQKKNPQSLSQLSIISGNITQSDIQELQHLAQAVFHARNMVNEPVSTLNAAELAKKAVALGEESGYSTEVYNQQKIKSLKMGGLLAVNKGSIDPPTFSVLEWKHQNAINKKPIVLVGKGIVFDTGGMNLKTVAGSLDFMKSDMGGAASVIGTIYAAAKNRLPVHVIGLIPATDNRVNGNAYVPGDVITMHSGKTVEVINTDAEGRLILADALSYAKKYDPSLVIDLATLTGSAHYAIGQYASVCMGTAQNKTFDQLEQCGFETYERLVRFPFWEEYGKLLKSDIADIKNLGGREAGAIIAGKFLEHFTNYPWIHIDIAGPAYLEKSDNYRGKGGSGIGVRLLYQFLKMYK